MTSDQPHPSEQGDGAAGSAGQGAQQGRPPVGKVRATASVPLPTRTPATPPGQDGQPPPATSPEQTRLGPFPPAGPLPPRIAPPASGKASVPVPPPPPPVMPPPRPGTTVQPSAPPMTYGQAGPPPPGPYQGYTPPRSPEQQPPPYFTGRAQASVPPSTGPASAPPASVPPATGLYSTSTPPAPTSAFPAAPTPASVPPSGQASGGPHYSDLVSMHGEPGGRPPSSAPHEEYGPPPAPAGKSRRGLVIGLVVVAVVFLLAVAGVALVIALGNAGDTNFPVNSCVKQDGGEAAKVSCSDPGAFTVVSKVDKQDSCPDPDQPFVVVSHKGSKDQVLCLRPASQK